MCAAAGGLTHVRQYGASRHRNGSRQMQMPRDALHHGARAQPNRFSALSRNAHGRAGGPRPMAVTSVTSRNIGAPVHVDDGSRAA